MEYAVVDLETTGLSPSHHHRIIEISIIRLDHTGEKTSEYTTLINPNRDLGPTHIHGIMAADVENAPSFETITGDILHHLRGAVVVAHNAQFDLTFLQAELKRSNITLPVTPHVCTMRLAREADPSVRGRSLVDLCAAFQIPYQNAHTAGADAAATASLFKKCLDLCGTHGFQEFGPLLETAVKRWPSREVTGLRHTRKNAGTTHEAPSVFMNRIISKLPNSGSNSQAMDEYLALLDQALLDRVIVDEESDSLIALAGDLGFGGEEVKAAHHRYLRDLVFYALEDEVITQRERRDLEQVAHLLGVDHQALDTMITEIKDGQFPEELIIRDMKFQGKTVCFSGELTCSVNGQRLTRDMAQTMAGEAGMFPAKSVTKKLDYLVLADPNSMSSKAKKARQYQIPIMAETAFWLMLGVEVN